MSIAKKTKSDGRATSYVAAFCSARHDEHYVVLNNMRYDYTTECRRHVCAHKDGSLRKAVFEHNGGVLLLLELQSSMDSADFSAVTQLN